MEGKLFGRFQLMGWLFAVGIGGSFPLHRRGWRVIGFCRVAGGWKGFLAPDEWGESGVPSVEGVLSTRRRDLQFFLAEVEGLFSTRWRGRWDGTPSIRGCCQWDDGICDVLGAGQGDFSALSRGRWDGVPNAAGYYQRDDAPSDSGDTICTGKWKENGLSVQKEPTGSSGSSVKPSI